MAKLFILQQTPKKSQFTLKRKKSIKANEEWGDLVCPMGSSGDQDQSYCSPSSTSTTNINQITVSLTNALPSCA